MFIGRQATNGDFNEHLLHTFSKLDYSNTNLQFSKQYMYIGKNHIVYMIILEIAIIKSHGIFKYIINN